MTRVRALVIDEHAHDATVARILEVDGDIRAVTAPRMSDVGTEVGRHTPDVVVLVPMSESAAIEAITRVMSQHPIPILLLTDQPFSRTRLLAAGAVDVMAKAGLGAEREAAIRRRVRSISALKMQPDGARGPARSRGHGLRVVGIAASTGGPQALATVLSGLEGIGAAVLVVQHIHPDFIAGFQTWMDRECPLPVRFASDGEAIIRGRVYIAPANVHLRLRAGHRLALDPKPESVHRPSADVLFTSIAEHAGADGVGVLLTGMGEDGVEGLLRIRRAGGKTIVQDEGSSAVFGMPRAAAEAGAAERVVPLQRISRALMAAIGGKG